MNHASSDNQRLIADDGPLAPGKSIPQQVEQHPRNNPDGVAIKTDRLRLTWRELNDSANRLARAILELQSDNDVPIALIFSERTSLVTAMVATLKAGKFYVPLDPAFPRARMDFILNDTQSLIMLTDTPNFALGQGYSQQKLQILNVDEVDDSLPSENLDLNIPPDSLANVVYTSGSTGNPKGVMHTHRTVLAREVGSQILGVSSKDKATVVGDAARSSFRFLLNGAGQYSWDAKEKGLNGLADWLIHEKITIYHTVPSVFRHFVDSLNGTESFPDLRFVCLRGEPVYRSDVELYRKHFSDDCLLLNELGITETGTFRQFVMNKNTPISGNLVPVGFEVEGKQTLLLDEDGKEVGEGEVGEIAIRSKNLSPGYWRRPDLTDEKFLRDPSGGEARIYLSGDMGRMTSDGNLIHLGRKDFQVKIRGNRIEIAEIEGLLRGLEGVSEAVVMARADGNGHQHLIAYVHSDENAEPSVGELREAVENGLPDYMVPSTFVILDQLPYLPNGKVDLKSLPIPDKARPHLDTPMVSPRTPIEQKLSEIWSEVLDIEDVGVEDSFHELGGHSLAASRVISRVIESFRVELPLKSLFESPTVADMALVITQSQAKGADEQEIGRMLAELESLSEEQARLFLGD